MSALTAPGGHMAGSRTLRNFINGASVDAADGGSLDLVDPATGSVFASSPRSGAADVDAAMTAAAAAFESWRGTTPGGRPRAPLRLADAVGARAEEVVDAGGGNTGKPRPLT